MEHDKREEIKRRLAAGEKKGDIAKALGIHRTTVLYYAKTAKRRYIGIQPTVWTNDYIDNGDHVVIRLSRAGKFIGDVLVDKDRVEILKRFRWRVYKKGYVYTTYQRDNVGHCEPIHHFVIGKPVGRLEVDHINRNRLDNRYSNLRAVTKAVNQQNTDRVDRAKAKRAAFVPKKRRKGSGCIHFHKASGKYDVSVQRNKQRIRLGLFATKEAGEAAIAEAIKNFV